MKSRILLALAFVLAATAAFAQAPFPGAVLVNGGWVPCDHPVAITAGRGCVAAPGSPATTPTGTAGATTPSGQTEFQFRLANLNFHSESYQWLVVAGPKAQYKGVGTINGTGNYGFMLTTIDGQINGRGGIDKFRIKIWDKATETIVYDNQIGAVDTDDPNTVLSGGSIVIHKQ